MPPCKSLILLLFVQFTHLLYAQQPVEPAKLEGLWKGTLYNDSTQKYYRYEIGISESNGKLSGFSHTWFLIDDQQYFGVKKLKVKIAHDGKVIIEDDGLLANNYPVAPAKGVRQLNVLTLDVRDSVWVLSGPFSTNRTRTYSPLTGTVTLQRTENTSQSSLVPHLQELGMAAELSFIKLPGKEVVVSQKAANPKKLSGEAPIITVLPAKTQPASRVPAAAVSSRKITVQQVVYFNTDSLQLSLYDNGEVDGDTVSVLMNGKIIMANERLSTNAVRKTIFIDPQTDSIELLMYAENLGSIPPNTGLLLVRDGKNTYEIRFSGDLENTAAIIFKRKKNP